MTSVTGTTLQDTRSTTDNKWTTTIHIVVGGMISTKGIYNYHSENTGGVMVGVLDSSAVDRGFEPRSGQTKDYKIGICCYSAKHAA
jgi:hypothetical protein